MDAKQAKLQGHRLSVTRMTLVSSSLQAVLVALFAWSGVVSWTVPLAFALASVGSTGLFTVAVTSGWNLRFPENWLLYAQFMTNYVIQIAFIIAAPQMWILFLASTLISFNYAMMSFTPRQFRLTWLGYGVTTAAALYAGRARFGYPALTDLNVALLWLFFFLAARRLALIGTQFSNLRTQLSQKNRALTESLARIEELASRDDLTGAFNRRHFMQLVAEERDRAGRTRQPFSIALFDLDNFKSVNDRFGHAAGDRVLCEFCAVAQAHMRSTDRFARYGGEEFVLLMPVTTPVESAALAVDRIRAAVAAHDWSASARLAPGQRITVSVGVATCRPGEDVEPLLARADQALYAAKDAGRDRFVMAD